MSTLRVAVLGIDGSGKSSLAQGLPVVLAAELGVIAGSAGEEFWVYGPDQDHLAPRFHPRGFPLAARLSKLAKSAAKRAARGRNRLYPYLKLAHMLFQDDAAVSLGRRYRAGVMVGDGNLILSASGRAGNYAREGGKPRERATLDDVEAAYRLVLENRQLSSSAAQRLPALGMAATVAKWLRRIGFDGVWLPDAVIFLDLPPATAVERIARRGAFDAHENLADMTHARESYVKALAAYTRITGTEGCVIDASAATPGEILQQAVEHLRPLLRQAAAAAARDAVLGTSRQAGARTALRPAYLFGYLARRFFRSAWRELTFPVSAPGRAMLREGYSAGVMRVIYEQDAKPPSLLDRVFFGYPLHRAVYDRLQLLTAAIEPVLRARLQDDSRACIFSAPSGFAYDLLRPLSLMPELAGKVTLVTADLDPHGALAPELTKRAHELGLARFRMILGDITAAGVKKEIAAGGPYDLALFVGLSSWLPKAPTVEHLRWLRGHLATDALLVTDCFSADTYAEGGRLAGYKANYYSPTAYQALLEWCGYAGLEALPASGRDRINHVFVTRPRVGKPEPVATPTAAATQTVNRGHRRRP
ncbi:MAG: hypothetical protein ABI838_01580 [Chloroflexota bacterium]